MYQDKRWKELRKKRILENPWCEDCLAQGIYTPALDVHHIIPWRRFKTEEEKEKYAFDPSNTVCLCRNCHIERHKKLREEILLDYEKKYLTPKKDDIEIV